MRVKLTAGSYCDLVSTYDKQGVGTNGLCVKPLLFLLTGVDFSFKESSPLLSPPLGKILITYIPHILFFHFKGQVFGGPHTSKS